MTYKRFLPGILWGIFMLVLTGIPGNYFPRIPSFLELFSPDKLVHVFLFLVFCFLILYGFIKQYSFGENRYKYILITFFIGVVYAGLTEIFQIYIFVGRNGNIYDFIADSFGCILGISIFLLLYRKKYRKNNSM
ncbi:MAG: VanZ family protein [Bacteroidales bacterium]|nr:VanZ family protein [Bacteroidales bacterium]